jgi:hypothetical protein
MSNGHVFMNDTPTKSKIYKFCEKKIEQWIRSHLQEQGSISAEESENPIEFKVLFNEESDSRQISCTTEVLLGNSVYRGWDLAADTQMAFMHSLKRLQPH